MVFGLLENAFLSQKIASGKFYLLGQNPLSLSLSFSLTLPYYHAQAEGAEGN